MFHHTTHNTLQQATSPLTTLLPPSPLWSLIPSHPICSLPIKPDNGRQFIDKELAKFYTGLGIKHVTSSVEQSQTNGQAEAANKVILVELCKD